MAGLCVCVCVCVCVCHAVPLTVALGGLDAYRDLVSSAVAQSVQRAASAMPNGLMLAISPHVSMWDASLAAEYDDVLRSLEPPPPAQAPLQLQTVQVRPCITHFELHTSFKHPPALAVAWDSCPKEERRTPCDEFCVCIVWYTAA